MANKITKKQKVAFIRKRLGSNPRWAMKALMLIYSRQTPTEKQAEETREHNEMGFSAFDAEILTSFAKQVEQGQSLSEKQMQILFKNMPKYHRQVLESSDETKLIRAIQKEEAKNQPKLF